MLYRLLALSPAAAAIALAAIVAAGQASAPYLLDNPAQILVLRDGKLLVAERGTHDRVLRVDPATGATGVFATGIPSPWGLGYAPDGTILVSSTNGLYRITGRKARPTRIAAVGVSPFAVLRDGRIAFANEASVGLITPGRPPRVRTLPVSVSAPHGLVGLPDGALALSDTGNGRILRIDPATGSSTSITEAVANAFGLVAEPSGSLLTVEYGTGRLLRVDASGSLTTVATGLRKPYALARTPDGTIYVTEAGELRRPTGSLRRVLPGGRSSPIRLRKPA